MRIAKFLFALALLVSASARGEMQSLPMPADNKLVIFNFDPNDTYTVLTMPDAVTDIQLMPEEKVSAMAIGDSVQWIIAKADGHIFVKPIRPNIFTSATVVTDKRTYQITLRSSPIGGKWYQRVSWNYPELLIIAQQQAEERKKVDEDAKKKAAEEKREQQEMVVSKSSGSPVDNLNFEYEVSGDADFKPIQVFDDGKFTWLKMNKKAQELPALFLMAEDGKFELVNYIRQDEFLKVQRLFPRAVLKLGKAEVQIVNLSMRGKHPSTSANASFWKPWN